MNTWCISFFIGIFFGVYGRDPFVPVLHSYAYTGYGVTSPANEALALVWIDGSSYCVRLFELVQGHTIEALSAQRIVLRDEQGKEQVVIKKPFNLKKLKG